MKNTRAKISRNHQQEINQFVKHYSDEGINLSNGFQKEVIQNAVGARLYKKFKDWKCEISIQETSKGKFVIIEDFGTCGLTGKNMAMSEIDQIAKDNKKLGDDERLARFRSMSNSSNTQQGPGLYGIGKSMYPAASDSYEYFFDSLRDDGKYIADWYDKGDLGDKCYEDNEAKNFIKERTSLRPKETIGTRIIIVNPKKEVLDSIQDGSMERYIQESWWLIIEKFEAKIVINKKLVQNLKKDIQNWAKNNYELDKPELVDKKCKVKKFGLYVFNDKKDTQSGIYYYRKNMRIAEIKIKDIPKELEGKFWGYIEVEQNWEKELIDIETLTHFGISKDKKNTIYFKNLKNFVENKVREQFILWGYIKNKDFEDKKLKNALELKKEKIFNFLHNDLKYEKLGTGTQQDNFEICLKNVSYPEQNSHKVTIDDKISFLLHIKNNYKDSKPFNYQIATFNTADNKIAELKRDKINILAGNYSEIEYIHTIKHNNSQQYEKNLINIRVDPNDKKTTKIKQLPYYFDADEPKKNIYETLDLRLKKCNFPNKHSRRVNFDESLRDIVYTIENKHNAEIRVKFSSNINLKNNANEKLDNVKIINELILKPFESYDISIDSYCFKREIYEKHLSEGVLELRARLTSTQSNEKYQKGDKIAYRCIDIFLNCDDKTGNNNVADIKMINDKDEYRRSYIEDKNIVINVGHNAYLAYKDYEYRDKYLEEQMLKQCILFYIKEGKTNSLNIDDEDSIEAIKKVMDEIERAYYKYLKDNV